MAYIINKFFFGAAALALTVTTTSYGTAKAESFAQFMNQPTMTGNWGGVRTSLGNDGINFVGQYIGQFGGDPIGGKQQGNAYNQQVIVGADWDLQKLFGWNGAKIHTYLIDRAGSSLENYIGSTFNEYGTYGAGENLRLLQFDYEQNWFGGYANTLVGYYPTGLQFAHSALLCSAGFLNNAFCSHPQFLGKDVGYQLGPVATWGGRLEVAPSKNFSIMVGITEVNSALSNDTDKGFDLNFQGATGALIPLEIQQVVYLGPQGLVGHYKFGGMYDTSATKDVADSAILETGRYAGYLMFDQMVYEVKNDPKRGLVVFFNAGLGDKRTAQETTFLATGFIFQGPFASRPLDDLYFGWAQANINPSVIKADDIQLTKLNDNFLVAPAEDDIELGYGIQVAHWMQIAPDVQYAIDPDAGVKAHYPNAWIFGFQTTVNF